MDYEVGVVADRGETYETDLLAYLVAQDEEGDPRRDHLPRLPGGPLEDFDADAKEIQVLYEGDFRARRVLLVGCGKQKEIDPSDCARIAGTVLKQVKKREVERAALVFPLFLEGDRQRIAREITTGLTLGGYEYDRYQKSEEEEDEGKTELQGIELLLEDKRSLSTIERGHREGNLVAGAVGLSRDLANAPSNDLTPVELSRRAAELEEHREDLEVTTWDHQRLQEEDMNLILGVGKGSSNDPCLIQLRYEPDSFKGTAVLAGKGVTFDSGGISIKPSEKMDEMKFDMCGAATVIGTLRAVADLQLPIRVLGTVPSAENMPGESATKPGDIITGCYGKSVEILNTDAEGRLLLADALGYISEHLGEDLDVLIDYATLTGACITALGHEAAGLMGNDDGLCELLEECGQRVDERVWQLPLWEDHSKQMESEIADVKNIGGKAGAITAGAFLREFVDEDRIQHWAHLDIAGTGWGMKKLSYRPEGGTGFGVRLTVEFLKEYFSI